MVSRALNHDGWHRARRKLPQRWISLSWNFTANEFLRRFAK
jgi:hypothetical protein